MKENLCQKAIEYLKLEFDAGLDYVLESKMALQESALNGPGRYAVFAFEAVEQGSRSSYYVIT